jgi:hypothetical protein
MLNEHRDMDAVYKSGKLAVMLGPLLPVTRGISDCMGKASQARR